MRIGVADEFRVQRIEQRRATGSLNMFVHGDLNWLQPVRRSARILPGADRSKLDTLLY
jgi:hypothetical protein